MFPKRSIIARRTCLTSSHAAVSRRRTRVGSRCSSSAELKRASRGTARAMCQTKRFLPRLGRHFPFWVLRMFFLRGIKASLARDGEGHVPNQAFFAAAGTPFPILGAEILEA